MYATVFAALLVLAAPHQARAALLDFTFSFTNPFIPAIGPVTGIARGLADNTANQKPLEVEVLSAPTGFGVGRYVEISSPLNRWTVVAGVVITFSYAGTRAGQPPVVGDCCSLRIASTSIGNVASLTFFEGGLVNQISDDLVVAPAQAVPVPSSTLLFATSLVLGGLMLRRGRAGP
ncbi:PEP-CTERM sorting domain-containing protein [Paracraurococcus ruber]|uniref:PEP-CTERM sorting domain-containing protein n=1 Tax=Paracraurococcus ruber TaxID=77675 RepID=UPI001A91BEA4|nr:PEP-CTERM sorting domain-containing protein [Paracraurococcus ruber]